MEEEKAHLTDQLRLKEEELNVTQEEKAEPQDEYMEGEGNLLIVTE